MNNRIELVERYGKQVWENQDTEAMRRGNCLCHLCDNMKPGEPDHCRIASRFFEICQEHGTAFILTRCDSWAEKAN
jgi:hypothetical protein